MDKLLAESPRRMPWTKTPIRAVALCRQCQWTWRPITGFAYERCPRCEKIRDVRQRSHTPNMPSLKAWKAPRNRATEAERRYRQRAVLLVGRGAMACVRCGCDDIRCLEINHKNGGGGKEHAEIRAKGRSLHRLIAQMKRAVDDLELLCRPCNAVHFLEMKLGTTLPFRIAWK